MKNVYIIDEFVSSTRNGIGTFLKAYISCLKDINTNVCLIIFNANCSEFLISFSEGVKYMMFPKFPIGEFIHYPMIVVKFLRLYIKDSLDNVFCFNHAPCDKLLQTVRRMYPLSKLIFIIHDQLWTAILRGNENEYRKIILNRYCPEIQNKYKQIIAFYEIEQRMYEAVDVVISLSLSTYNLLIDIYKTIPKDKFRLIPHGLKKVAPISSKTKQRLRKQLLIGENEIIILFVGRLTELKGINVLYAAFESVVKENPLVRLVVVGHVPEHAFSCFTNRSFLRITYTGLLKQEELIKWYQIADIGVIPSYTEQCCYVGLEMMMHGIPIVSSDAFGLRDMFRNGDNAIVASIGGRTTKIFIRNLSIALKKLVSSSVLRYEIGQKAKKVFMDYYSLNMMKKRYEELFKIL